jgi:hypothetical protein
MVAVLHIWFNFIIIDPICIVILILQIKFHIGMYIFKTLVFVMFAVNPVFFTYFVFVISSQFISDYISVNFTA